jgi:hypothetical protein
MPSRALSRSCSFRVPGAFGVAECEDRVFEGFVVGHLPGVEAYGAGHDHAEVVGAI